MAWTGNHTVCVPLALARGADGPALHLRVDDCAALNKAAETLPWRRIREVTLPRVEDFAALRPYWDRAHWNLWWRGFHVGLLEERATDLQQRNVIVLVTPDDPNLHEKLMAGESLSLHMEAPLSDPDRMDLAALESLLSHALNTDATRPLRMEPMASLVRAAAGRHAVTLWDLAAENVRTNLHVDPAGRVSVSARLAETHPLGTLTTLNLDDVRRTPAYRRLCGYAEGLFRSQSDCATCWAYPLCGGWLRYVDPAYDCTPWQRVLNALQDAVGKRKRARTSP